MANDLNRCEFIGRLGVDPEVSYTAGGTAVAKIRLAVGRQWKDRDGNKHEETEWVRATAFAGLAEVIGKYPKKGDQLYVSGRMKTSEYEKDGIKRYSTEIIIEDMQMLGGRSQGENNRSQNGSERAEGGQANDFDDDIPF